VPVFNGEETVSILFNQISEEFDRLGFDYEVIFVYDCGNDNSWEKITGLKRKYPGKIKALHLTRNFGQHNAIICGFEYVTGQYIFTMDEDLQHSPKDFTRLIEKQKEGDFDVVYGYYSEIRHSLFRNITSSAVRKIITFGIPDLNPKYSPFRLIKTPIALETLEMQNTDTFLDGYLAWITQHTSYTTVNHYKRFSGKSSYSFIKLFEYALNIIVTFSDIPLKILRTLSTLALLFSFGYGMYLLIGKILFNDIISGFETIVVLGGFGTAFLILGLGIIGEYIFRINLKLTRRPNSIVRK